MSQTTKEILRDNAGVIESKRRRQTGLIVTVYRASEAGLDDCDGELPYSTVCEAHGQIIAHETLRAALLHASDPLGWCEVCNGADPHG